MSQEDAGIPTKDAGSAVLSPTMAAIWPGIWRLIKATVAGETDPGERQALAGAMSRGCRFGIVVAGDTVHVCVVERSGSARPWLSVAIADLMPNAGPAC